MEEKSMTTDHGGGIVRGIKWRRDHGGWGHLGGSWEAPRESRWLRRLQETASHKKICPSQQAQKNVNDFGKSDQQIRYITN
jgi:hypothetical protein